ncbi:MAG: hypothetical protein KTR25_03130 [Myxococcales bacterium]|nr:hypothetical protein [Myxococcales bacterium]
MYQMHGKGKLLEGINDGASLLLVIVVAVAGLSAGIVGLAICLAVALLWVLFLILSRIQGGLGRKSAILGPHSSLQVQRRRSANNLEISDRVDAFDPATPNSLLSLDGRVHSFSQAKKWQKEKKKFMDNLGLLFGVAVVARFATVILVNATPLWFSFGPDAITWEYYGRLMILSWSLTDWSANLILQELGEQSLFPMVNALAILLFGSARYPVSFLNAAMGIGTAFVAAKLALQIYSIQAARRTFILVLFYPSLMLWSAMNFREVWAHMTILLIMVAGQSVRSRFAPGSLMLLLVSLGLLYFIRPYLFGLILIPLVVSMVVVRTRQLPFAVIGLIGLAVFITIYGQRFGLGTVLAVEEQLETIQNLREGLAYGGSAYGENADTRTISGALIYLPYGVAQFLFAPFPWNVRSFPQLIALPESIFFLYLAGQAVRQILYDIRTRLSTIILPLLTIITLTCAYGLVSGNEGTAFRHRAQIVVITIIFSAAAQTQRSTEITRRQNRSPLWPRTFIRSTMS